MDFTIIILTYNEEKNILDCIDSFAGITSKILVVDSFSTDQTISLITERNIKYLQHKFENYSKQRNWSQENNPFQTEWVFHIDAGERATPNLVKWLKTMKSTSVDVAGFMFSRQTYFLGRWIRYGGHYPNYHLRLFKVSQGKCEDKAYDQHFVVEGKTQSVPNADMIDFAADNIQSFTIKHSKWALMEAIELIKQGQAGEVKASLKGSPIEQRRWLKNNLFQKMPIFLRSITYFIYRYFFKMGFLDGKEGLVFHLLQGFWFRFLIDSLVFEITYEMKKQQTDLRTVLKNTYQWDLKP